MRTVSTSIAEQLLDSLPIKFVRRTTKFNYFTVPKNTIETTKISIYFSGVLRHYKA